MSPRVLGRNPFCRPWRASREERALCRLPIERKRICAPACGRAPRGAAANGERPDAVLPRNSRVRRVVLDGAMIAARLLLGPRLGRGAPGPVCIRLLTRCFQVSAVKKAKAAGDRSGAAYLLSPEQLERIRKNKEAARQRLAERNVPPGFGESWRRQLAAEFSKPYFVQVSQ